MKERQVARCCQGHHLMIVVCLQYTLATDCFQLGYNAEGHCKGEVDSSLPRPQKLNWEIAPEVSCHSHITPNTSSPLANRTLAATMQKFLHTSPTVQLYSSWQCAIVSFHTCTHRGQHLSSIGVSSSTLAFALANHHYLIIHIVLTLKL